MLSSEIILLGPSVPTEFWDGTMQMVREVKAKKKLRKVNIVEILCTLV
jgi:hypothetical protein